MKLFGCFAAPKIIAAFSTPTVSSSGLCNTSSACRIVHRWQCELWEDVVQKLPPKLQVAPGDPHDRLALRLDFRDRRGDQMADVLRIGGGGDRRHGPRFGHLSDRGQHGRAAETVPDQQGRGRVVFAQECGRGDQISDVRGESGVGEVAAAFPQTGEVEPQYREAARRQSGADPRRRQHVLGAGKAMGEQRVGRRRSLR